MAEEDGVDTQLTRDTVSASTMVDAPPEAVFDYLRRPANHAEINGDHTVRGITSGPEQLGLGDSFGMKMKMGAPYRIRSKVTEFEPDRKIMWRHPLGHQWRWEVEPAGDGKTKVTETFDMSSALFPPSLRLMGYPKGHAKNVAASVRNVAAHFAGAGGG